jgi:hypothetical protein
LVETTPDQFLFPLQISALHREQLILQQPLQEFENETNSLELYNDQSIILTDNLAAPELFNFLTPTFQPITEVPTLFEVEKHIIEKTPVKNYAFDEMVYFSYPGNAVNIQVNPLAVMETQIMFDLPIKDVKKFPEVNPNRRKVIQHPMQELLIDFKQWAHYSISHP